MTGIGPRQGYISSILSVERDCFFTEQPKAGLVYR